MTRQIIAMGGGGFGTEPSLLDRYFVRQTGHPNPRVCFIGTATGDAESYVLRFYMAYGALGCRPAHLPLFKRTPRDLESFLLDFDAIYVGGGNTRSLLAVWRDWGLDRHLRTAWERGVLLGGLSAGSICWFEQGVTDSIEGALVSLDCLGLLSGSNCPHYDGESERRPSYHRLVGEGAIQPGLAADDGVALHFVDTQLKHVISAREGATAYRVGPGAGGVEEEPLEAQLYDAHMTGPA